MKNTRSAVCCADPIDVITNFAVITNVLIKRVHCITFLVAVLSVVKFAGFALCYENVKALLCNEFFW